MNTILKILKKMIIQIGKRIVLPFSFIIICYYVFNPFIVNLSFITLIRYFILMLCVIVIAYIILDRKNKTNRVHIIQILRNNSLRFKDRLYLISYKIIEYGFALFCFIYIVGRLDRVSIVYNYIILFLFGVYCGYRLSMRRESVLNEEANEEK